MEVVGGTSTSTRLVRIDVLPLSSRVATAMVGVSGSPVCSPLSGERPHTSTAGSSRQVGPVPACREVNQGRVATEAETVCENRKGGDWAS